MRVAPGDIIVGDENAVIAIPTVFPEQFMENLAIIQTVETDLRTAIETDTKEKVLDPIPIGHKISLTKIQEGMPIVKYGDVIGKAMSDIRMGQHVHVYNVTDE